MKEEKISYNRKCCYVQVAGEKKSLKVLIEMAQFSLKLIELRDLGKAKEFYHALPKKPIFWHYIEDELFTAKWTM